MRKILLASHGHLASGLKSSVEILTGDSSAITAVDAYVDDSDYTEAIRDFIDACGPDDEAVIFTDILGGSVFQKVALLEPEKHGVVHVTGMNLAVVMECLLTPDPLTTENVDAIAREAAGQLKRVNVSAQTSQQESADDFFA
jgi:PTS system mannose-specific IIA component